MDALTVLEQMEEIINNSNRGFSGNTIKVNVIEMQGLIEDLRTTLLEDLRQARRIVQDKENILAEAQREASSIMEEVEQNIGTMIDDNKIVIEAQHEAERIIFEANEKSEKMTKGAKEYADEILANLESHLEKTLETIEHGRNQLKNRQQASEN